MKKFILYWVNGQMQKVEGNNIADAFRRAGYGGGAINVLDFYEYGDTPSYTWCDTKKTWIKVEPEEMAQLKKQST